MIFKKKKIEKSVVKGKDRTTTKNEWKVENKKTVDNKYAGKKKRNKRINKIKG